MSIECHVRGLSGVNVLEILGDEEADSKSFAERRGRKWDRPSPLPRKNEFWGKMNLFT